MQIPFPGDPYLSSLPKNQMYVPTLGTYSPYAGILIHFQKLLWLLIFFSLHPPYVLWLPWVLKLLPVIEINDCAGRSREEARAQQLSNVRCQKKPKQYICNELDLLLELEAAVNSSWELQRGVGRSRAQQHGEGGS